MSEETPYHCSLQLPWRIPVKWDRIYRRPLHALLDEALTSGGMLGPDRVGLLLRTALRMGLIEGDPEGYRWSDQVGESDLISLEQHLFRPYESDLERQAREFAAWAHFSVCQRRRYLGEPYIHHPESVVRILREAYGTDLPREAAAAAWLHDVVEDTGTDLEEIRLRFGDDVSGLVEMLTDVSTPADGNRAARKARDREHTARASPLAKSIKLADLIDNTASIVVHDPSFAKVYLREKRALLEVLTEGHPVLYRLACTQVGLEAEHGDAAR